MTFRPPSGKTTFHRDGSVTFFDIVRGQWDRQSAHWVPSYALTDAEQARVDRIADAVREAERIADERLYEEVNEHLKATEKAIANIRAIRAEVTHA